MNRVAVNRNATASNAAASRVAVNRNVTASNAVVSRAAGDKASLSHAAAGGDSRRLYGC